MKLKRKNLALLMGGLAVAGVAYAATTLVMKPEITLSEGGNGHKPKLQRASDGTLVAVYGDSPAGAQDIYDTKGDAERPARDIYAKWCTPSSTVSCDDESHWTKATTFWGTDGNISGSALSYSIQTAWQGGDPVAARLPYYGNTDKPNIKTSGPVVALTWVSSYCPDEDLRDGVARSGNYENPNQRAIRYIERNSRVIPFSCTWVAYSADNGKTWQAPIQLSNGERDAKQDASSGTFAAPNARINISWQEDPEGLQLGEADGPGDGASGANVTGGTDVWYTHFQINVADPANPTNTLAASPLTAGTARALGYRVSDNWELETKFGLSGQIVNVRAADGTEVDGTLVEKGNAGAARPNIGMVGTTTVLAWEETKGAEGLDDGKFIRYQSFAYATPPSTLAAKAGCIISDPNRNARRVRFLTQSAADATGVAPGTTPTPGGINLAIFWKEGEADKGGSSDVVLRRGMVDPAVTTATQTGLNPSRFVPAVNSAACATSVYADAINNLTPGNGHQRAENISSRAAVATAADNGLLDDTERNFEENALAHRGVLRGNDLWVGYNYTSSLVQMWAGYDNYNFWLRNFTYVPGSGDNGGSWALPKNVSKITDKRINVREPRIFGTPSSNTAAGYCENNDPTTATDPTFCQNRNVVYLLWGSQENVSPFDPDGGDDLGVYATVSMDGGNTFATPVRVSEEMGSLFDDDESAFETQPVTRPDGTRFYTVFNTSNALTGTSAANYRSGDVVQAADPAPASSDGGGCTTGRGNAPFDPTLPALAALGLIGLALRRTRRGAEVR